MAIQPIPEPDEVPSADEIVRKVYREGIQLSVLADKCMSEAANGDDLSAPIAEAALLGFHELLRAYGHGLWRSADDEAEPQPRSGHKNSSGRFKGVSTLPGRGIFARTILTNDGTAYLIGDLDADVAARLRDEYAARENGNAAGRKFFGALADDLIAKRKRHVRDLGKRRVEGLREEAGFRV